MKKTFDKAKTKAKRQTKKKWYVIYTHGFSVYIWALPFLPFVLLSDKIDDWQYSRLIWNEQRATKVLDKVLPLCLEYLEEENAYFYCMDWNTSILYKKAPWGSRKWAKKFTGKLQDFIKDGYENSAYEKTVEEAEYIYDDTWVKFVEKKVDK